MKYKNINVDEILIEFQNCLKVINDEEIAFDYFSNLIEDKLEDDAYIDFVSDDIIQIRFEKETNKSTFKYVVDFYKKYIEDNKNVTNFCNVKLVLELEDFLINEYGESYNSEEFTFYELKRIIKYLNFEEKE
ncbi:spore photoproduct [Clostridium perfringens]|uniref:spore photoproduct n=1 Tax=Clostridium perfringens TaxID=1502 RepID=UPI003754FCB9